MDPLTEDIETVSGTPETATAVEDSSYGKILEGEAEAPIKPDAGAKTEEQTTPEVGEQPAADGEVEIEVGGKVFTVKQSELLEHLENRSKIAEREKTLSEKEKSLNRDYTQKSQQVAEFRKSVEGAFGRFPEAPELQALGKLWKSYFQNPQAKQVIDQILTGRTVSQAPGAGAQEQGQENPYISQLEQKISELEERLGTFTQTFEDRDNAERQGNAQKTWQSWTAKKAEAGIKITEDVDAKMAPFITALKQAHPDWEANQILDIAYKHATIDDIEKTVQGNVLKSVDEAKKQTIPRIKPKSAARADSEKTYADILLDK